MTIPKRLRILVVEDDRRRIEKFREWLPDDVITVVAASAGRAIGILERDRGTVYAGILLDHDLQERSVAGVDDLLSGTDVAEIIIRHVDRDVPILVHSMNISRAPVLAHRLAAAGFPVTRIAMEALDQPRLLDWLDEVRDFWDSLEND